ncbi:MAG: PmoA family protein [Cyclobacteriaceae bacterium]|nr:PmoA family protein [Cyclobacteriaceae bacterium]
MNKYFSYPKKLALPYWSLLLSSAFFYSCSSNSPEGNAQSESDSTVMDKVINKVEMVDNSSERKVDVLFDGELFTSYFYPTDMEKPVLFPIISNSGKIVTRHFPYIKKEGERVDHIHHVGHWFNYGDVNGLDFWNNSSERGPEIKDKYGSIIHQSITNISSDGNTGSLTVQTDWVDSKGTVLLNEVTNFVFHNEGDTRYFDRFSTLTALDQDVSFTDNKEGMFAIRVTRAMELPTEKPAVFTDSEEIKRKWKNWITKGFQVTT